MSDSDDNEDNDNEAYLAVANNQIKLAYFAPTSTNQLYSVVICTRYIHNYLIHTLLIID